MSKIPFRDRLTYTTPQCNQPSEASVTIPVLAEIKLWSEKFFHLETPNDELNNPKVGKGDDIGFTLVFGNDGELPCPASPPTVEPPFAGNPTLEDTLDIQAPITLKLMSLCIDDEFELWVVGENGFPLLTPFKVERCHIFHSGVYTLQLRKKVEVGPATPYFDIPCHFICCISMLFQIEFPACPECPDCPDCPQCQSTPIVNGCFTDAQGSGSLAGWTVNAAGGSVVAVPSITIGNTTHTAVDGCSNFALLSSAIRDVASSISQEIKVCAGDTVEGFAFVDKDGGNGTAYIRIDGTIIATLNQNEINDGWLKWSYTFSTAGTHTLLFEVVKESSDTNPNHKFYLGVDAVKIV